MYKLHCERTIACSHNLTLHKGKCKNPHGHNFKVVVDIDADKLINGGSSDGMVMDFGDIKDIIDYYDHKHLNTAVAYNGVNLEFINQPTAERLAKKLAEEIMEVSTNPYINFVVVRVYETDTQYAEYFLEA